MTAFPALAVRIRQELADLHRCVNRALALMSKAAERGDLDYLDGVALNLHAFRGFRHVVRNVYGYNQDPDRVRQLAVQLPDCYDTVSADLDRLAAFLDTLR